MVKPPSEFITALRRAQEQFNKVGETIQGAIQEPTTAEQLSDIWDGFTNSLGDITKTIRRKFKDFTHKMSNLGVDLKHKVRRGAKKAGKFVDKVSRRMTGMKPQRE